MNIKAGTYEAKILDYGIVNDKQFRPQVKVVFGLKDSINFSWFGNLSNDKGKEITTKNLLTMGATPQNIDKVELGALGGVLNMGKIFSLVIEDNTYNGKTSQRIKYINDPSRPKMSQEFINNSGALSELKGQAAQIAALEGKQYPSEKTVDNVGF